MPDETVQSGLSDKNAGALAYITIIPAIIFLVAAPYNQSSYIRFHAWQCVFLHIVWFAIGIIAIIPILGWIIFAGSFASSKRLMVSALSCRSSETWRKSRPAFNQFRTAQAAILISGALASVGLAPLRVVSAGGLSGGNASCSSARL